MKMLEINAATAPLAEFARRVNKEVLVLTVRGKPKAALVPIENADWETLTLSSHPKFLALIERSRARQKAEGGIPSEEMRRRLGLKGVPPISRSRLRKKAARNRGRLQKVPST